jgi:transposase-like protein
LLIDAARPVRHLAGDRWCVDETYVKVSEVWSYVYRAVDQHGQVIDIYASRRRDIASARTFFTAALTVHGDPAEVVTDRATDWMLLRPAPRCRPGEPRTICAKAAA